MKWGRKKPTTASSPHHHHSISHLFPSSWFTKFKQMGNKPATSKILKENPKGKQNLRSSRSPKHSSPRQSGFHSRRLSFGKDNIDGDNIGGTPKSTWSNSSKELGFSQGFHMNGAPYALEASGKNKKTPKLNKTEQRSKDMPLDTEISPDTNFSQVVVHGKQRNKAAKHEDLGRTYLRIMKATQDLERELEEAKDEYRRSVEKDILELESEGIGQVVGRAHSKSPCLGSRKQNHITSNPASLYNDSTCEVIKTGDNMGLYAEELSSSDIHKTKNIRRKEATTITEKQRKSVHIGSESQRKKGKVRVYSPRPTSKIETCKIKAIEDMKKAKLKKKIKEQPSGETRASHSSSQEIEAFESFAVVKCSVNPVKDFRVSMLEMIIERGIRKAEDLEELLACYLTLNADEYHDLIIKVFRQVWSDLEEANCTKKSEIQDHS